jgi:hypothetical protein
MSRLERSAKTLHIDAKEASTQDAPAQSAASLKCFFCAWTNGLVHPIAWLAFRDTFEFDPLDGEPLSNQISQISAPSDRIAACAPRCFAMNAECTTHIFEYLTREKRNLAFVVHFVIEESVAAKAMPSNTFDLGNFLQRIKPSRKTMAAEEIVAR